MDKAIFETIRLFFWMLLYFFIIIPITIFKMIIENITKKNNL